MGSLEKTGDPVGSIGDPYYTMEIVDFMGDNCACVGTSATGTKAGNYAIIGSGWKGKLPNGVKLHLATVHYKKRPHWSLSRHITVSNFIFLRS